MNTVAYLTPEQCRAARVLLKWSQEELAYQANVSVLTIRHFEKEKTVPLRVTLAMISGALGIVRVNWLEPLGEVS